MHAVLVILKVLLALAMGFGLMGWFMWRSLKHSDDPWRLVTKWVASAIILGVLITVMVMCSGGGYEAAFIVPIAAAACGIALGIFWGPHIATMLAAPITNALDGGLANIDPGPLYSIAEAKRKRGWHDQAITEVRRQLERYPTDFPGWMLLAEIQAEDQRNVTGAIETVEQLIAQPGHAKKNIAFALSRCADWELKFRQDRTAARRALERITMLLPDTEQAQLALQRIAHLSPQELLAEKHDPHRIAMRRFDNRVGLRQPDAVPAQPEPPEDLAKVAEAFIARLKESPFDNEAREKLAILYAEYYQRLDLAEEQLEQLVTAPNQPPKQVIHWLHLIADLRVKTAGDVEGARKSLRRITEMFPQSAHAEQALNRMAYLNLETRGQQKSQVVKLGSYEKYLGLK
jgi:tetratricopeptide (TPR) repeat protein